MILTEAKAWGGGARLLKPRAWLKVGALANHALQLSPLTVLLSRHTGRLNWHSLFYFMYFFSKTTNVSLQHLVRVPALKRSPHRPLPSRQHGLQGQGPPHEPLQCAPGPGMPCHLLRLPRFVRLAVLQLLAHCAHSVAQSCHTNILFIKYEPFPKSFWFSFSWFIFRLQIINLYNGK